jgi:glyoxylase I family protein
MKIEHFALNVEDPVALAQWYIEHFGLKIESQLKLAPFTAFLADDSRRVLMCDPCGTLLYSFA